MKTLMPLALVLVGYAAAGPPQFSGVFATDAVPLKEEAITIEYTSTSGEATVVVQAEIEDDLRTVEIFDPAGNRAFSLYAEGGLSSSMSGFVFETQETGYQELFDAYPAGEYFFSATRADGRPAVGSAVLSHTLLRSPRITYPTEGQVVPLAGLTVTWDPAPGATAYRVVLEQGESDNLRVDLPASVTSFAVPLGVLEPGLLSHVEVGVVAQNGNSSLTEVEFTTL